MMSHKSFGLGRADSAGHPRMRAQALWGLVIAWGAFAEPAAGQLLRSVPNIPYDPAAVLLGASPTLAPADPFADGLTVGRKVVDADFADRILQPALPGN